MIVNTKKYVIQREIYIPLQPQSFCSMWKLSWIGYLTTFYGWLQQLQHFTYAGVRIKEGWAKFSWNPVFISDTEGHWRQGCCHCNTFHLLGEEEKSTFTFQLLRETLFPQMLSLVFSHFPPKNTFHLFHFQLCERKPTLPLFNFWEKTSFLRC